ncbi:MAG: aminoacyl-tRNA hydrolase [Acidobacteria bacterium]|nr:aminoacyl-tRNA hydrolase [Acidobacteriota bacterium]
MSLEITPDLVIPDTDLQWDFVRASGPGGQHVNKAATAVQLRFQLAQNTSLPAEIRERLRKIAANRINAAGELIIDARRFRSQDRNRQDALDRLKAMALRAARKPKVRRRTRPSPAARERRLGEKHHRGGRKESRRPVDWPDE